MYGWVRTDAVSGWYFLKKRRTEKKTENVKTQETFRNYWIQIELQIRPSTIKSA